MPKLWLALLPSVYASLGNNLAIQSRITCFIFNYRWFLTQKCFHERRTVVYWVSPSSFKVSLLLIPAQDLRGRIQKHESKQTQRRWMDCRLCPANYLIWFLDSCSFSIAAERCSTKWLSWQASNKGSYYPPSLTSPKTEHIMPLLHPLLLVTWTWEPET